MDRAPVWLGFGALGERVALRAGELRGGAAVLGRDADSLTFLIAASIKASGLAPLVLDLSGRAAAELSGYMRAVGAECVMRDALKLDEADPQCHAQLVSSAISTMFNLPAGQESVLDSALSAIASENGYASPSAIFDRTSMVAGHRATDKQEVEGRLAGLYLLNESGDEGALDAIAECGGVVSFGSSAPLLGVAQAALVLSKLVALALRGACNADAVMVSDAHRIFRAQRYSSHSRRFQDALMTSAIGKVISTEFEGEIDERVSGSCGVRMVSSSVWNEDGEVKLLSGTFMLQRVRQGSSVPFHPRRFEPRGGQVAAGPAPRPTPPGLSLAVLEAVSANRLATKPSVAAWLSVDYGRDAAVEEIDRMVREQFLVPMRPEDDPHGAMAALKMTLLGEQEMKRLRENGEAGDSV